MRRSRLLVPLLSVALVLSLAACAAEEPEFPDISDLPGEGWRVATPYPDGHVEEDTRPDLPELSQEEAIAATEKLAMDEDRFWALIDLMGGTASEVSVDLLADELANLNETELVAFEARFTLHLFALDTLEVAQWYATHDPISVELRYFSDDAFLYERCATVGAGRAAFQRATETSSLVLDETDGEAENLLYATLDAAEAKGFDWGIFDVIPLSVETGGNEEGWAEYDASEGVSAS